MKVTLESVSDAYVKTRDEISELNKQIDALKEMQSKREDYLASELTRLGLQNVKTPHGVTVFKAVKESVTVADWDVVFNWIQENACYEYLTKGVSKAAVLDYMGPNRENPPPPGVDFKAWRTVGVRKS